MQVKKIEVSQIDECSSKGIVVCWYGDNETGFAYVDLDADIEGVEVEVDNV